jgi:hypothetical protein
MAGLFAVTSPHNIGSPEVVIFGSGHVGTYLDCQFRSTQQPARLLVTQIPHYQTAVVAITHLHRGSKTYPQSNSGLRAQAALSAGPPVRQGHQGQQCADVASTHTMAMTQWVREIIGPSSPGSTDACGCKQARSTGPSSSPLFVHSYMPQWGQLLPELRYAVGVMVPSRRRGREGCTADGCMELVGARKASNGHNGRGCAKRITGAVGLGTDCWFREA